jgi:hypothetical protein
MHRVASERLGQFPPPKGTRLNWKQPLLKNYINISRKGGRDLQDRKTKWDFSQFTAITSTQHP